MEGDPTVQFTIEFYCIRFQMTSQSSRVLIAGRCIDRVRDVLSLVPDFQDYSNGSCAFFSSSPLPVTIAGVEIDTKYFTANLVLRSLDLSTIDSSEELANSPTTENTEGLILVASPGDASDTFETCIKFGHARDAFEDIEKLKIVLYTKTMESVRVCTSLTFCLKFQTHFLF